MCLDRPGGSPDLLIETADGAFWNGSDYPSTGGTCMGDPSNGTRGVIAANAAEAESMCGMCDDGRVTYKEVAADNRLGAPMVRKNGVTYAVYLVETTDPDASPIRVRTTTGIKAIRQKT